MSLAFRIALNFSRCALFCASAALFCRAADARAAAESTLKLTTGEIVKGAVLSWLLNKGHDEQAAFSEQFALAYSAYRTLTSGNETEAADLLDSAGCTDRDASLLPAESLPRAETLKNIIGE